MNPRLKAEKILQELQYDFRGFEIEQFLKWIGELRGRRIRSTPWEMPPAMFGAWLVDEDGDCDYIFYRIDAPPVHPIHIQLHELAMQEDAAQKPDELVMPVAITLDKERNPAE